MNSEQLDKLVSFLRRIPSITLVHAGVDDESSWWVKLRIDINSPFAWNVVQQLGFVLNYLSLEEQLPTIFKPVSPPPYLNGGPSDFLSWVIEPTADEVDPNWIADVLEERLPSPVDNLAEWEDD